MNGWPLVQLQMKAGKIIRSGPLRALFEILVAAPFATKDAALGHWVELGDVVAFLPEEWQWPIHNLEATACFSTARNKL